MQNLNKMKKLLLLPALFFVTSVLAQFDNNKLVAGIKQNEDLNRLDSIARNLNYKGGEVVSVWAQFVVDEHGNLTEIKARGPHPAFEAEAIRILKAVPQMDPAIRNGKAVSHRFSLPINFRIETKREEKRRLKREKKKAEKGLK